MARQLGAAMRVLRGGGIVAFPTDTVYGLGCNALNSVAVVRVFEIKRRPRHMALPVLISDIGQLPGVARVVPETARLLAERFWPGGLTLVLPRTDSIPNIVTARSDRVGIRVPAHSVPVFLARAMGAPLVGTSANVSGLPSCRTAEEVRTQLGTEVDMIVDGGESPGGVESTVVDFKDDFPVITREGAVSKEQIWLLLRQSGFGHYSTVQ
ncbi:MAG: L-threonylcarbamoyladenylate synthase [Dehalococcoidia bacterium]|nr:L-threonylcarbamoyladenylate synthase [Dehalococcoidia bacterium]